MGDIADTQIRFRRNLKTGWESTNPVLGPGEPGYERDTRLLKIGDGYTKWNDLPYFVTDERIQNLIHAILAEEVESGGGAASSQDLLDHINSLSPHPAYDDGPSLVLLYENRKA